MFTWLKIWLFGPPKRTEQFSRRSYMWATRHSVQMVISKRLFAGSNFSRICYPKKKAVPYAYSEVFQELQNQVLSRQQTLNEQLMSQALACAQARQQIELAQARRAMALQTTLNVAGQYVLINQHNALNALNHAGQFSSGLSK